MSEPELLGDILARVMPLLSLELKLSYLESRITADFDPELSLEIDRVTKQIEDRDARPRLF